MKLRAAIVLLALAPALHGDPPPVRVSCAIEAAQFLNPDIAPQQRAIEAATAATVKDLAAKLFPYAAWESGPPSPGASNTLLVKIVERPGAGDQETFIEYTGTIQGQAALDPAFIRMIYEWFDDKPTHDPGRLQLHLRQAVEAHFTDPEFLKKLQGFLKGLPLARSVTVLRPDRQILVPIAPRKLRAARDSTLRVDFAKSGTPGFLILSPLLPRGDEGVQCSVSAMTFSSLQLVGGWNDQLPTVLQSPQLDRLTVYIEDFRLDSNPGTSSGRVDRLE